MIVVKNKNRILLILTAVLLIGCVSSPKKPVGPRGTITVTNLAKTGEISNSGLFWSGKSLALNEEHVYKLKVLTRGDTGKLTVLLNGQKVGDVSTFPGLRQSFFTIPLPEGSLERGSDLDLEISGEAQIIVVILTDEGSVETGRPGADVASWIYNPNIIYPGPDGLKGRGAKVPFITIQAEDMEYVGEIIGPSREYRDIAAEAVNRSGVNLIYSGDYIEFLAPSKGNSILLRYALPDGNRGDGIMMPLNYYIDGKFQGEVYLTSGNVIVYGDFPWSNMQSDGKPRHWFDEVGILTNSFSEGALIRLERPEGEKAKFCIIDLVDVEDVLPPLKKPEGYFSILNYGAIPNDGLEDNEAIESCIKAVKKENANGVWIPAGVWNIGEELYTDVNYQGAGMWYTTIKATHVGFRGINRQFTVRDLKIDGSAYYRNDSESSAGFEGNANKDSVLENIWITHTKVGVWTDLGTDHLVFKNNRVRNTMADGINLFRGTKNSVVQNNHFRGTGDDSIALWSSSMANNDQPNDGNQILNNTVESPWLANGIAVYGGKDTLIEGNLVRDTIMNGSGIDLSSNFDPVPFSGFLILKNNTLIRCGSYNGDGGNRVADYEKQFRGALWIDLAGGDMSSELIVDGLDIYDATLNGITIEGPGALKDAKLKNVNVFGSSGFALRGVETAKGLISIENFYAERNLSGLLKNYGDIIIEGLE